MTVNREKKSCGCSDDIFGTVTWHYRCLLHKKDVFPSGTYLDGTEFWYDKDEGYHRENDLPAIVYSDGTKKWFKNGQLHRENGLPACEYPNGTKTWCLNAKCYRADIWIVL